MRSKERGSDTVSITKDYPCVRLGEGSGEEKMWMGYVNVFK